MKAMFQPGPPLPFREKITKKKCPKYSGIAEFAKLFETDKPPDRVCQETPRQIKDKARTERMARHAAMVEAATKKWDPANPREAIKDLVTKDAYKTLFVARLSYDTTEKKLQREFEQFGEIKKIRVVHVEAPGPAAKKDEDDMDATMSDDENANGGDDEEDAPRNPEDLGKPRGYAFVEFDKEPDMRTAYKRGDGRKVDGRRILVDVERGRTVRNWKPRRLGGGLGTTRKTNAPGTAPAGGGGALASYAPPPRAPSSMVPSSSRPATGTVISTTRLPSERRPETSVRPRSPENRKRRGASRSRSRDRRDRRDRDRDRRDRSRSRRDRSADRSRERRR